MDGDRYNWISRRAHQIWQQDGCPSGRDREHWLQAVSEFEGLEREDQGHFADHTKIEKVLVVEDEPLIRYAAVDALEQDGFDVLEAANADEALVLLQERSIDAVFTDINMPGSIDGLGLVSLVRARFPDARLIVTSGHVQLGHFDLPSGVSFLPKPYTFDALIKMLKIPRRLLSA
ncbi:response regulator [Rhizobium tibeticum]|nr:response regulator [Rhizobium tibeticum]